MDLQRPFEVVTPTKDGDVLQVLALADESFTVGQLHRILTTSSDEGIRKVLRRLVAQGIVLRKPHGSLSTYRLNRDHLAAGAILAIAAVAAEFRRRLEGELESWPIQPVYAAVFGSAGRGKMTISSDIDILLVRQDSCDEDAWQQQVLDLTRTVTQWTGNEARPLEYTVAELSAGPEPVLADVVRDGLTLHGDPSWFRRQLKNKP
jgi:predicted nucleotidyltransferase